MPVLPGANGPGDRGDGETLVWKVSVSEHTHGAGKETFPKLALPPLVTVGGSLTEGKYTVSPWGRHSPGPLQQEDAKTPSSSRGCHLWLYFSFPS